jgi:hypothetical protein
MDILEIRPQVLLPANEYITELIRNMVCLWGVVRLDESD